MTDVFLDGAFMDASQARISPMDRGFLFADGVYEVIPSFNGVLFRSEEHLRRLERSLAALQIASPYSSAEWTALCREILERNGGGDLGVYLQITRGAPPRRDHGYPAPAIKATVFMSTSPIAASSIVDPDAVSGGTAITVDDLRWSRCDIKSISLLPNIMAKQQAIAADAAEAILIRDGVLTEGSSTNVFIVKNGRIVTPPRSNRILGGITRDLVIELCGHHELALEEREISRTQLLDADEIWITSSTKDVLPIVSLDGVAVGDGKPGVVWKKFARQYGEYKRSVCG